MTEVTSIDDDGSLLPSTDTEKRIAAMWQDLFGLPAVAVSADFFELGGNSLTAIKFLSRVEDAFGPEALLPDTLFASPRLRDLAAAIDATVANGS